MLDELVVRNLGIIEEARLEPGTGLTVITGETGTGKTLLLGALRLLLGQGARSDLIGPFDDEASVEGRFVLADGREIGAGRRLTASGRSRAYLNGSIASAAALDEAATGVVEIVAQHDQLAITRPAEIRAAIDRALDGSGKKTLRIYRDTWDDYRALLADQRALGGDRQALERERDLLRHQVDEITSAGFAPGDDTELETRLSRLRNAEALRAHLGAGADSLDRARDSLGSTVSELRKAAVLDQSLSALLEDLEATEDGLGDLALRLGSSFDGLDADERELADGEERLRALNDLRRKYGPTLGDVLAFESEAAGRLTELDDLSSRADTIEERLAAVRSRLTDVGTELLAAREKAAKALAGEAERHLRELGFSDPLVAPRIEAAEPSAAGADSVRLTFASDRRLKPGEIAKVASGGELSRLVLALRLAGGAGETETLVFDEIDAGVGGATALAVGRKLASLAEARQVLCVTHLPQVAAFADRHYVVTRAGNDASVGLVDADRRLEELSRMLAGLPDSDRGKEAAEELMALARSSRAS